jgi:hypothetical protein
METCNTKTTEAQPSYPSRELWQALQLIFNHYFLEELGKLRMQTAANQVSEQVAEAVRLLDCWLDVAEENGWIEENAVM